MCLVLRRDSRFVSRNCHATDIELTEGLARMALKSSSVINLVQFIVIRQTKHDSNAVYYFSDHTNVDCFFTLSLPPSADSAKINIISTNGKQDALKQPEANTDLLYFSALSYCKSSVETHFPIFAIAFSY